MSISQTTDTPNSVRVSIPEGYPVTTIIDKDHPEKSYWINGVLTNMPPPDSLKISMTHVREVYFGLKRGEAYKKELAECKATAEVMNNIVQDLSKDIKIAAAEADRLNSEIAGKNQELIDKSVQIQSLKDKKIPWYRHPVTIGIAAFALGVYVAK